MARHFGQIGRFSKIEVLPLYIFISLLLSFSSFTFIFSFYLHYFFYISLFARQSVPLHTMKTCGGSRYVAPLVLSPGSK